MNVLSTIYNLVHTFKGDEGNGAEGVAKALGYNSTETFRKKVNPNIDTHNLNVRELITLIDFLDTDEVAKSFAEQRSLICIEKPIYEGFSDQAILDLFLKLQKEIGEMSAEVSKSLSDGSITWDEFQRIDKEYNDFITAAAEIMSRLRSYMAVSEENKIAEFRSVSNGRM